MATEPLDWDDGSTVTGDDFEDDEELEWVDLDAGETLIGEVREVKPNCGNHNTTVLKIARGVGDVVLMWSNNQIDRAMERNDLGEGDVLGFKNTDETETFTPEDGDEPIEYTRYEVKEFDN